MLRLIRHAAVLALAVAAYWSPEQVRAVIAERAEVHGVSAQRLINLAVCESNLDPDAVGAQKEEGLFQLHPQGELLRFRVYGYQNPWDVWEQADFTARRFAEGAAGQWSCAG